MLDVTMNVLPSISCALLATLSLVGCGGGSSGGTPGLPGEPERPLGDAPLPDLVAGALVTNAQVNSSRGIDATVTITNAGEAPASVAEGWFLISTDPDFDEDYHYVSVRLAATRVDEAGPLPPGISREYSASSLVGPPRIDVLLDRQGAHYARIWVNPDLSARFVNPENEVVESRGLVESNYANNLSELAAFDWSSVASGNCTVDEYENNDSLQSATSIELNTLYSFNGCDDLVEVMSVRLEAGAIYEIREDDEGTSALWTISVIAPDLSYLVRGSQGGAVFTAEASGTYYLAAIRGGGTLGASLALELVRQ